MNAEQAQALFDAEKRGVLQIRGQNRYRDARCAMGVLEDKNLDDTALWESVESCPLCGSEERGDISQKLITSEVDLVVHFNDVHRMTFSEIARKLGPDSV